MGFCVSGLYDLAELVINGSTPYASSSAGALFTTLAAAGYTVIHFVFATSLN
jgi:hypothetical protein